MTNTAHNIANTEARADAAFPQPLFLSPSSGFSVVSGAGVTSAFSCHFAVSVKSFSAAPPKTYFSSPMYQPTKS